VCEVVQDPVRVRHSSVVVWCDGAGTIPPNVASFYSDAGRREGTLDPDRGAPQGMEQPQLPLESDQHGSVAKKK